MIKIFFATFFIAELIIAVAVILKIWRLDKFVNDLNAIVCNNRLKTQISLIDLRIMFEDFSSNLLFIKTFINEKKREYTLKTLKTSLTYLVIFLLRGKYKKTIFAYQVIKEIYDGINDAEF